MDLRRTYWEFDKKHATQNEVEEIKEKIGNIWSV
jgi:hypothetical protein